MTSSWISDYVDTGDFTGLFVEELGWNRPSRNARTVTIRVDDNSYTLTEAASYKGVVIWVCPTLPPRPAQRAIDRQLKGESAERVVIFHDGHTQLWRWPQARDTAGAGAPRLVAHEHAVGRPNEALRQRLNFIKIEIGGPEITVIELVRRLRRAFDSEKVTKSFYSKFAQQHQDLTTQIKGIAVSDAESQPQLRWYASILLNRLMFIYFMQRKGFLDGDQDYLRNRLQKVRELKRPGSFYEFYRDFLVPLFHEGLGADADSRVIEDQAIRELIGDIPYINGGIFSQHPLEVANTIRVPDEAFERMFDFFDQWQWHLDARPTGNPNEINPDVLGYIFEQFVNHRDSSAKAGRPQDDNADKGAYYTEEDVTGYMTSSTLIPLFLSRLEAETGINPWRLVSADVERYIRPSVKHGIDEPLPPSIAGQEDSWPRPDWNQTEVSELHGLPGESWWEVHDRRRHVRNLIANASAGRLSSVADAVTNNIDLEVLAVDLIDGLDNPDDVAKAWNLLSVIRVLDPTCGSGAFLFSALSVLHRLYAAVLEAAEAHLKTSRNPQLKELVETANAHPDRDYFLLKHAALRNIYGVDLMPEAVEIARLRLFLKLIAQVQRRADIEPLPDLEFNIRSGNILVGALTPDDIRARVDLFNQEVVNDTLRSAEEVSDAYRGFSSAQDGGSHEEIQSAKRRLTQLADSARGQLDTWWFEAEKRDASIAEYRARVSPFHWLVEFPETIAAGGFDVVIGNPPYVAKNKVNYAYSGFATGDCPDIYGPCVERAAAVTAPDGRMAMITPLNLAWGGDYAPVRQVLATRFRSLWSSTFDQIPARLFEGAKTRNAIVIGGPDSAGLATSSIRKWVAEYRPHLLDTQRYTVHSRVSNPWPKVGQAELVDFATSRRGGMSSLFVKRKTEHRLGFRQTAGYWLSVFTQDPPALDGKRQPKPQTKVGSLYCESEEALHLALSVAGSRTMFLWWIFNGDIFDVLGSQFGDFPLNPDRLSESDRSELVRVGRRLESRLATAGDHLLWTPYAGAWYGNFDLNHCRDITEEADDIILRNLGLDGARESLEIEYRNYMKNAGERPGTVRGALPDRDR
jgi:hypothetical protein